MARTIELMIVDESRESRQSIKEMIGSNQGMAVIGEARNGSEALQRLVVISPRIILMSVPKDISESINDMEKITLQYPYVSIIVLSAHRDWYYVREYMRAGAKDYLYMPVTPDILIATIEEVYRMDEEVHKRSAEAVLTNKLTSHVRVVSFFSSKGGVGKTTIAVNTAIAAALQGKNAILVDLDLQSGTAHLLLNLDQTRTVSDLTNEINEIDPDVIERYLLRHESGLSLLAAPRRPEEMELVKSADIRVILQSLKRRYDYIFIDTSPAVNDALLTVLEMSDECMLINTLNIAVLKNNRTLLDLLNELNYDLEKVKLAVNRANVKNGVTLQDVAKALRKDVFWELNDDYHFVEVATNEGVPFVMRDKHHRLSKQVFTLTQRIDIEQDKPVSRRRLVRKLFERHG